MSAFTMEEMKLHNMTTGTLTVRKDARIKGDLQVDGIVKSLPNNLTPPSDAEARRLEAYQIRVAAALGQYQIEPKDHITNGDEDLYPSHFANYSKGMHHDALGVVIPADYEALLTAVATGNPDDYDAIPVGGTWARGKYHSPQAGLAFELEGADSHCLQAPPAPEFSSAQRAADQVELYWMAIMRDVSFEDYGTNANTDARVGYPSGITAAACADLNALSDFRGAKPVTPANLFRALPEGNLVGPYISQFLLQYCPFGSTEIDQKAHVPVTGVDFMTDYSEWLSVQNGNAPATSIALNPTKRYLINGRDLGYWVRMDVLYQAYFQAMLCLGYMGCPVNPGNPYVNSSNQLGFASFGGPHIAALLAEVCSRAIKAAWFQKWQVHRCLRPEEFGGRVHNHKSGSATYPIHSEMLNCDALNRIHAANGTWLLPQCFAEGAPFHPSYLAGHATVSAACVTILKAWFDGSFVIPSPVKPNADGSALVAYVGDDLTVEGELNKVSANVGIGRHHASVHYRSDYDESILMGEKIAIEILRDQKPCYNENFAGFTFKKFDGSTITV